MKRLTLVTLLAVSACAPENQLIPLHSGSSNAWYRMSGALSQSSQPTYYAPPMQPMFRYTDCDAWRNTLSCTSY